MPDHNFPAFKQAERELTAVGYEVISPTTGVPDDVIEKAIAMGLEFRNTEEYNQLLRRDIGWVMGVDAVAVLPGWEDSSGAQLEVNAARAVGKRVAPLAKFLAEKNAKILRWTGPEEFAPVRTYEGDAGFDLIVAAGVVILPGEFFDVPAGIRVELPPGVWAMITGRSSTLRRRKLLISQGIIDNGWRGELFAGCWNLGDKTARIERGERLAQLIPFHQASLDMRLMQVDRLSSSDRGEAGFGSTGA